MHGSCSTFRSLIFSCIFLMEYRAIVTVVQIPSSLLDIRVRVAKFEVLRGGVRRRAALCVPLGPAARNPLWSVVANKLAEIRKRGTYNDKVGFDVASEPPFSCQKSMIIEGRKMKENGV